MSQPPFQPPPPPPPQQQPPTLPSPFPPIRKKPWFKRWWAIVLFVIVGLGILGALLNPDGGTPTTTAVPAATVTVTKTAPAADAEPAPTVTVTEKAEPEPEPKPKPEPDGLGEGTYQVGTDAPAGRYKTTVPGDSSNCYWQRAKDDSGELDSIIANDNVNAGARVSVTLKKGEFFTSNGCGTWVRQ